MRNEGGEERQGERVGEEEKGNGEVPCEGKGEGEKGKGGGEGR